MKVTRKNEIEELLSLFKAEDEEIAEARNWYSENGGREFTPNSYSAAAKYEQISAYYRELYAEYDEDIVREAWAIYRSGLVEMI
jgi:hypothetical protein